MSSPDRQQIIDAWETMDWLKSLINPDADTIQGDKDRLLHAIQDLAEALPDRPKQTMDELECSFSGAQPHQIADFILKHREG